MHCIELENTRPSCEGVVCWFLREYLPNEFFFLVVEEKDLSEEGVYGWCMRETQNEFLIQIHSGLGDNYISILLHELYHLYQYYYELPRDEEETLREELKLLNKYHENH
jgi:hypothetical protein